MGPTVSIGIPVYNGERFLAETLDSILAQEFTDFEVIISDNASTDRTPEVCAAYRARDTRLRYVRNDTNRGAAYNYNQTVRLARGRYFKWASYDDLLAPGYLGFCVAALDEQPTAVLAYPRATIIDEHGLEVRPHEDRMDLGEPTPWARLRSFTWRWSLCNPVFGVIRTEVLRRTRLIQPHVSSDVPLLADLAVRGCFVEVPERLFFRRIHATTSHQGRLTRREIAAWFDPESRPSVFANRTIVFGHILRVIVGSDAKAYVRLRLLSSFCVAWTARRMRVRGGQVKAALRRRLRPTATESSSVTIYPETRTAR